MTRTATLDYDESMCEWTFMPPIWIDDADYEDGPFGFSFRFERTLTPAVADVIRWTAALSVSSAAESLIKNLGLDPWLPVPIRRALGYFLRSQFGAMVEDQVA